MAEESKTPEETPPLQKSPEPNDDTDAPASRPGEVYLIAQSGSNFFKVGRSVDPDKRLSDLQTGQPQKLIMKERKTVGNMVEVEQRLLAKMRDKFVPMPGGTEWFEGDIAKAQEIFLSLVDNIKA
ncbi:hypothetical protein GBAR_LOCUS14939 [Geodia barretti]|uniref:Bacteriophage T5 Orf172 DNA-binding domain-containing protein n=1 Tax=Geodia barretti TaxID=519541 RepID=A0AA35S9G3_GEOBA|nr:hypothetical protein GBAR_LOCUS14939 [Geodia barretti]